MKLYMMLLGCKPPGRNTEQHDIFFGIGEDLKGFVPAILRFWPEADEKVHVDAFRTVTNVDGYKVEVVSRTEEAVPDLKLYFLNLGGYKENDFEEYHFKRLVVAESLAAAITRAKSTVFWKSHYSAHIDDKYALGVDDAYEVEDLLPYEVRQEKMLKISPASADLEQDIVQNGYFKLSRL